MINGKQRTVLWHVDDFKISHMDKNVVTQLLDLLSGDLKRSYTDHNLRKKASVSMHAD